MKIIDLKCAVIGRSPVVRIVSDAGISGFAQVETFKPYLKPQSWLCATRCSARIRPMSSA